MIKVNLFTGRSEVDPDLFFFYPKRFQIFKFVDPATSGSWCRTTYRLAYSNHAQTHPAEESFP